jgi:aspartate-semialdehyde dehydrogenase
MADLNIGVLGASGMVGQEILVVLGERSFPVGEIRLAASQRSTGDRLLALGRRIPLTEPDPAFFAGLDLVFSAVAADVARRLYPLAKDAGAVLIDKSNAFRMDPLVPLVVPEVNPEALSARPSLIASPNCSTIPLVMALSRLRLLAPIEQVDVATYQAVSGTGRDAVAALTAEIAGQQPDPSIYPKPIAFNVLPLVDALNGSGHSLEEDKLRMESRKVLSDPALRISSTAVRVPVYRGHAEAVTVTLGHEVPLAELHDVLTSAPGLKVVDPPELPTPIDADGNDLVWIGRLRRDRDNPRRVMLFLVTDNLRKGAATNAVQIAEQLWGLVG